MTPSLEEIVYLDFVTSNATGAAADADTIPTAEVFKDATDTPILTPTVTKRTSKTGNYRVSVACAAANGFESGKTYNVVASAAVGGVAAKAVIGRFQVRTRDIDDLAVPGSQMDLVNAPNTTARDAIATTVESHLLNEGDSQMLINAIVGAIGNQNVDQAAFVAAVRADLERVGGKLTNLTGPAALETSVQATLSAVGGLNNLSQAQAQTAAAAALTAFHPPTKAELDSAVTLLATNAQLVKVLAAVYDSLTVSGGNILNLSNGKTQTIGTDGARTTSN